jgi:hypothetical protein
VSVAALNPTAGKRQPSRLQHGREGRKQRFFEKKRAKNFAPGGGDGGVPLNPNAVPCTAFGFKGTPPSPPPGAKIFLVLFL